MENPSLIPEDYIGDLCEKYNIGVQTAIDCINNAIRSYVGNAAILTAKNEGNIDMQVFRLVDFKKIDLTTLEKDKIKKISKLFNYYLNIAKYQSSYNNFKHFIGYLAFGNIVSKTDTGYKVEIDRNYLFNIPAGAESFYPLQFRPASERNIYKGGDYLAFIIHSIKRTNNGNLQFTLSRTNIKLPALLIENELGINGIKTLMRIPGVVTKLKTELNIPQKTIDYAKELLKGEKIYVSKAGKKAI
ncbi:MAG: hypothetical protein ACYCS0_01070 [bacterium]